jgi:hypothetical protein
MINATLPKPIRAPHYNRKLRQYPVVGNADGAVNSHEVEESTISALGPMTPIDIFVLDRRKPWPEAIVGRAFLAVRFG